ncbi:acetyl-CoA synthetase-like protein [Dendrothele bispora CBS 962.96]|uniref:Acetyl-CoA synthetase-like protein n=1 Tax=Dendrothele bispora (strain CBS 962.96) TaxID=1314807 RepID=A0A4S8LNH7_DENBC|nr:acetyl-CoA synthetase-like protein [Dendrothele bispora CBS 962.96]
MALLPPLTGEIHLPGFVDFHLQRNGDQPAYTFAYGVNEVVTINFAQLGRAVHRGAIYFKKSIGAREGETLALIASVDSLLYVTVVLAAVKAGYAPFMISPRNSPAAVTSMLTKIGCTHILRQSNSALDQVLLDSLQSDALTFHELPTLERLYGPDRLGLVEDFEPYSSHTERSPDDIGFVIHSSGSTGFPKPVPQKFLTILHWMNFLDVSGLKDPAINVCGAMGLPGFHAFGVNFQLLYPLTLSKPTSLFPPTSYDFRTGRSLPDASPIFSNPTNILQYIVWTRSDVLMTVPSFVTMWRNDPHCVETLKSLKAVCCSSGPLPQNVGDDLIKWGVPLCTSYGATEFGIPTYRIALDEDGNTSLDSLKNTSIRLRDWRYVGFNKHVQMNLVPVGIEGGYELRIYWHTWKNHQPAVENIEDGPPGYATHDIVQIHPTKPFLWRLIGRTDEVIVLSSGEKVVPNVMENELAACPLLSGVLMFGRGRPNCGLLVEAREPKEADGWAESLVNTIWPLVEKVNSTYPNFGRITREMVIVIPFKNRAARVDKGGIARAATLQRFEEQIDKAYREFENNLSVTPPLTWSKEGVREWLQKQVINLIPSGPTLSSRVTYNVDIFTLGFDSVSAVSLRARIKNALGEDNSVAVPHTLVYDFPTIEGLAGVIANMVSNPTNEAELVSDSAVLSRHVNSIQVLTEKYAVRSPHTYPSPLQLVDHSDAARVVLLTGSTGSLGSYIFWQLLEDDTVTKIFAVNRPSSTLSCFERQQRSFKEKGINIDARLLEDKVTFIEGDVTTTASDWIGQVNVIIYNAWRVDFNLSLSSFEPLIQSTHSLIETIIRESSRRRSHDQCTRPIRFIFISSTSAAQNWDQSRGPVEELVVDPKYAVGKGYGESKHVVEAILKSCPDGLIDHTCLRIGQLCGGRSPNGYWATSDWVPAMLKSSVAIGTLPESYGTVSWISLQDASRAVVELAFSSLTDSRTVPPIINLVHPRSVQWNSIIHVVAESLNQKGVTETLLPTISFPDWVERLRLLEGYQNSSNGIDNGNSGKKDLTDVCPALKILPFFTAFAEQESMARLNDRDSLVNSEPREAGGKPKYLVGHATGLSGAVRKLREINNTPRNVDDWIGYWKDVGFI